MKAYKVEKMDVPFSVVKNAILFRDGSVCVNGSDGEYLGGYPIASKDAPNGVRIGDIVIDGRIMTRHEAEAAGYVVED